MKQFWLASAKLFMHVDLFPSLNDRGASIHVHWWCVPRAYIQVQTALATYKQMPLSLF